MTVVSVDTETGEVQNGGSSSARPNRTGGDVTESERPEIVNADGQIVRPFDEWLADFRNGAVVRELSIDLHELIGEVSAQEKGGAMTVVVQVSPVGSSQIQVTVESKTKTPKPAPAASLFYIDRMGNPTRHDPMQTNILDELKNKEAE